MELSNLIQSLKDKKISVLEIVQESLARAKAATDLNAFISLFDESSLASAKKLQDDIDKSNSDLTGLPIAVKDIFMTLNERTTCGSQILKNYQSPYESHATAQLKNAGMINIGKCNLDEFAMGTTGENSSFGPTLNPWNKEYAPGGSSSGSAVAVAARIVLAAMGTDTGGSVRMPSSYCGITGIKPTYGNISRRGIVAYASSLDQAGVFATSAKDLRLVLNELINHDPYDSTSLETAKLNYDSELKNNLSKIKIGVAKEFFTQGVESNVSDLVHKSFKVFKDQQIEFVDVSFPNLKYVIPAYYIIACAEASSNLARYDGLLYGARIESDDLNQTIETSRSQGFGLEVQRRIMLGTFVLSHGYIDAYYRQAQKLRKKITQDFNDVFAQVDVIITPATPTTAPKLNSFTNDPVLMYSQDICTAPVNLAGLPAIAFPGGMIDNLPIGIQLIGPANAEDKLLTLAETFQANTEHHLAIPPGYKDWS